MLGHQAPGSFASVVPASLRVSRLPAKLTWRALDSDVVAGQVSARVRPDGRCFVYFDTWQDDAYPLLADAVVRDLGRDLYTSLEDTDFDGFDACAAAGFSEHRHESYYRVPIGPALTRLAGATLTDGLDVVSAADADISRLRLLDDALRQDVPGTDGWCWDAEEFRAETFGRSFDAATYIVAVDRTNGEYAGLVRVWTSRGGPRLGLIGVLPPYRRRGAARALLAHVFDVLVARGEASVTAEADDTNTSSVSLLVGLGARRYGGSVELLKRFAPT